MAALLDDAAPRPVSLALQLYPVSITTVEVVGVAGFAEFVTNETFPAV